MPKGSQYIEAVNKTRGKNLKKPEETNDLTTEMNMLSKSKSIGGKRRKSNGEDVSNLSNLVDAARIVEGSNQKMSKRVRGKQMKGKEPQKLKKKVRGKSISRKSGKHVSDEGSSHETNSEVETDDSDAADDIASIKRSITMMMDKLVKLEGKRKRKKKKIIKREVEEEEETSDEEEALIKPLKSARKEAENPKDQKTSEAPVPVSVVPGESAVNMNILQQYHNMMMMQQQQQFNMLYMHPMMGMIPPGVDQTSVMPSPIVPVTNPTTTVPPAVTVSSNGWEREAPEKYVNVDVMKSEKNNSSEKRPSKASLQDDGNETDVSEVYEPTTKDKDFDKYLSLALPTPSFLGFVDEINKDEKSIQSMVVSSTKRNAGSKKEQQSKQLTKYTKQPSNNPNIAGILMNLFPQGAPAKPPKDEKDTVQRPEINNSLRSIIVQSRDCKKPIPNLNQQEVSPRYPVHEKSVEHIHPRAAFKPSPYVIKTSLPERPPETKRYVDNAAWLRDCSQNLYLQDQDGDT